ncbi:MAG: hypothetical protein K8T20_00490 [Planctomycetes bacterium]|nr:hypothetical protein [Planctomycetota bacterium]
MRRALSVAAVVMLGALSAYSQEPPAGLKIPAKPWHRAWLARERVKKEGERLAAKDLDALKKEGSALLGLKRRLADGKHLLAKRVRGEETALAELEKKEADLLARIRTYGDRADHLREEIRALQDEQEIVQRRLREHRLLLDLDLRPRLRAELDDFRGRCELFARRVTDAFRRKGLIRKYEFDKWARDLMRRQDYSPDSLGHTHCNAFVNDFAEAAFGYGGLRGKTANEIADYLKEGKFGWTAVHVDKATLQDDFRKAQEFANQGYLVVATYRSPSTPDAHGHVAVVLPGELKKNGMWGMEVPDTAQAGHIVYERGPMSVGFEHHKEVVIYVRKP